MELVDIGVNLTHPTLAGDLPGVLRRARAAGVGQMVVTGTNLRESRAAAELARQHPGVLHATAGVHPHDARHWDAPSATAIAELAARGEVVALGETGLDFNRNYSPPADQERAFVAQLELAADLKLPVFLHERDASERFLDLLQPYRSRLRGAVLHCFTGNRETLAAYRALDLHIGITGWICDERRGGELQTLVGEIPLERLMLETDAPYLLPRSLRPRPKQRHNEPAFLPEVLRTTARCLGMEPARLATITSATARRFFGLVEDVHTQDSGATPGVG